MPDLRPLALLDLTPLLDRSGFRGIGRYVRDLAYGLEEVRDAWQDEIRISALVDLRLDGHFELDTHLSQAADRAFAERGSRYRGLHLARRMALDAVAERSGAALLHVTEALGTPLSCKVPRVVTCHDLIPLRFPRQYLGGPIREQARRLLEQRRYRDATRVVAISRATESDLESLLGIARGRIEVILHGIDLRGFDRPGDDALVPAVGLSPYVCYAGAADWRKNVEGMFAALAIARRSVSVDLVWAGELSPKHRARVERLAQAAGVRDHVRFVGFVAERDMPALYRGAIAHLFLSRLEGFGLSVVEAMAAGCPVIVARGSATDLVTGEAAIVVDADDHEAAGRAIVELASNPATRQERVDLGRQRARFFDRNRMAREYADLYKRIMLQACSPGRPISPPER